MTPLSEFFSSLAMDTIWHGGHCENDRQINLRAGILSMIYEKGNLRYISDGKHELIRMIYSAVRDKDWLTIEPVITGEQFEIHPDSFRIKYHCLYRSSEIHFSSCILLRDILITL